ncbi:hypothetical protein [Pseudarthrobacter chlorophenolicus]|nr:hypothetical protein [Pseudarthrobacter chlorophenolicus]
MTTSQNRQPKGITTGGQFAPDTHAESTLLLDTTRDVVISPGESESFQELADGDVIESLNVNRSDDGAGYWISPAKTVNLKVLITDADPRLHGDTLDSWFEKNGAVIEDFLATRYEADITAEEGWDEVGIECSAQLPDGPLTEAQIVDAAWNRTKVVQLHNESDHGSFGSENLGRLLVERVEGSTVLDDPYTARAAGLRVKPDELTAMVNDHSGISDVAAVAIAKDLGSLRNARGVIAYPAIGRLASRGYLDSAAADLELQKAATENWQSFTPDRQLARRIDAMRSWMRNGGIS